MIKDVKEYYLKEKKNTNEGRVLLCPLSSLKTRNKLFCNFTKRFLITVLSVANERIFKFQTHRLHGNNEK